MKAKKSNLRLESFELLESQYEFIAPAEDVIENVNELFADYGIEVDFKHDFNDDGRIWVLCTIGVNVGVKPIAGYRMEVTAGGEFMLESTEELDEKTVSNLKFYSTLNMMINTLRNVMFQLSNLGPMKGYLLPPIDVLDLFRQKRQEAKDMLK